MAVGIADGFARARAALAAEGTPTGPPAAVVQLHTGVGLGNGIGMLYQAMRGGSPPVVVASDAGVWKTAWVADPEGNIVEVGQGHVDQPEPPPPPTREEPPRLRTRSAQA